MRQLRSRMRDDGAVRLDPAHERLGSLDCPFPVDLRLQVDLELAGLEIRPERAEDMLLMDEPVEHILIELAHHHLGLFLDGVEGELRAVAHRGERHGEVVCPVDPGLEEDPADRLGEHRAELLENVAEPALDVVAALEAHDEMVRAAPADCLVHEAAVAQGVSHAAEDGIAALDAE